MHGPAAAEILPVTSRDMAGESPRPRLRDVFGERHSPFRQLGDRYLARVRHEHVRSRPGAAPRATQAPTLAEYHVEHSPSVAPRVEVADAVQPARLVARDLRD